jgi:hypothetical protein
VVGIGHSEEALVGLLVAAGVVPEGSGVGQATDQLVPDSHAVGVLRRAKVVPEATMEGNDGRVVTEVPRHHVISVGHLRGVGRGPHGPSGFPDRPDSGSRTS